MNKYLAAVENKHPIIITDEEINKLNMKVDEKRLPSSLELNFIIRKNNNGENLLYLGPNIGSSAAGKTFGRFSYLGDEFSEVLDEVGRELKESEIDQVELCFVPSNIRRRMLPVSIHRESITFQCLLIHIIRTMN